MDKLVLQPVILAFKFACFCLAGYLVYVQFDTYFGNKNVSNVEYQRFKDGEEDVYPTFSICAVGRWIYVDKRMPDHSTDEYSRILQGKTVVRPQADYDEIKFDQVVMDVNDFITEFLTSTNTYERIIRTPFSRYGKMNSNSTLEISYYDPNRICVTKTDFQINTLVAEDRIEIDMLGVKSRRLSAGLIGLDFYVHQKGQLLRRLRHPTFHLDRDHIKSLAEETRAKRKHFEYKVMMNIISVDVIRFRPDYVTPCDPNLHSEDHTMRNSIMMRVGCIPPFMKPFSNDVELIRGSNLSSNCNQSQYAEIHKHCLDFTQIQDWFTRPCTEMNSIVTVMDITAEIDTTRLNLFGRGQPKFTLIFKLDYLAETYRETVSILAFDLASLWSQIGGFIGIFLGYSLLQVPDLAQRAMIRAKSLLVTRY